MESDSPFTEDMQQKLDKLPKDIRELVYSADMGAIMQTIGKNHQLHIDQVGDLEAEAAAVMIGTTKPEEFVENVMDSLRVDKPKADAIVRDVNSQLFVKIRESMKKAHGVGAVPGPSPTSPAPASPTPAPPAGSVPKPVVPRAPNPPTMPPKPAPLPPMQPPAPSTPPSPKPPAPPQTGSVHSADLMLTQKTANTAPMTPKPASSPAGGQPTTPAQGPVADTKLPAVSSTQPPKPKSYGVDPYREPIE